MKKITPAWLGIVLAFLGVIIPIGIAAVESSKSDLTIEWVSTDNLVSETGKGSELKVFFDRTLIEDPKLLKLQIKNTGNEPIKKSDFDTPLQLEFDSGVSLLKASISSTIPHSIPAKVSLDSNILELEPLLLNEDDTLNISVIISGEIEHIAVLGRIANIQNLELIKRDSNEVTMYREGVMLVTSIFTFVIYLYFASKIILMKPFAMPKWLSCSCALSAAVASGLILKQLLFPYKGTENFLIISVAVVGIITTIGYFLLFFPKFRKATD
ncbi:hypothetical protein LMH77_23315 [Vibrio lentus]|uniref:hypothetical protein n=1 Tax=Vibrio lentus TaxID=136468 RepID=UPI000C81717F|nr:hypothetical protein [Vibrio lentus]MCC4785847.1 hypothetical protein [Vibrio lentus]PMJ08364.1 hypothetical protein BCU31_20585 [Vibrio lentus]